MGRFKEDFFKIAKGMGIKNAFRLILFPRILHRLGLKHAFDKAVVRIINKDLKKVTQKYVEIDPIDKGNESIPNIIWVFWWQGFNAMPPVIKECYNSVLRNANGREVRLLSGDNYQDFVQFPSHIIEKFNSGIITYTHFSDILRVALLGKYGGLWIDAAIFVTKPISYYKGPFYSPKLIMNYKESSYSSLWVFGVLGSSANSPFFSYMYEMFIEYWSKYNEMFAYLMMDYFVSYGYRYFSWLKDLIDDRPIDSPDLHWSRYNFTQEVDDNRLNELIDNNTFISLTYRIQYPMQAENGRDTYYAALLKKYNSSNAD